MDGAAGRVSLRGMGLLHGSRERRERDARAEVSRRLAEALRAAAAAEQARNAAERQRAAWRDREREALGAMQGVETGSGRLAAHWVEMDRLADEAVRLRAGRDAAEAGQVEADEAVDQARAALRQAARLVQKGGAVMDRIRAARTRAAEATEQVEGEDDAIRRHAAGCG